MGEIRIVGSGKTRGYPYPVCKKKQFRIDIIKSGNAQFLFLKVGSWTNDTINIFNPFITENYFS